MSDKGLLFKKRKNNHGSHHKCSKGSGFPRHSMNHYPGTHLGMKLRYSKPSIGRLYREWGPNYGCLRTNRIIGFVNKFIGKPYNDLVKAFYTLIKDLRDSHKGVGLSNLEWHFERFRYRRWKGSYYVDDNGLVQMVPLESERKRIKGITKQQVTHNRRVKIPDFGAVSLPRDIETRDFWSRHRLLEYGSISYKESRYKNPRLLGSYWCNMDGKILLLPVYHVPESREYAKYWADTHNVSKPKKGNYYGSYPKKWDMSGYCDRFSDLFRPGNYRFKWAQNIENEWVIPVIQFSKNDTRYDMYYKMYHSKLLLLPNTKSLALEKDLVERCIEQLALCEDPSSYWYNKTEECQKKS